MSVILKKMQVFTCVFNNSSLMGAGTENGEVQDRWQFIPAFVVYYETSANRSRWACRKSKEGGCLA